MAQLDDTFFNRYNEIYHPAPAGVQAVEGAGIKDPKKQEPAPEPTPEPTQEPTPEPAPEPTPEPAPEPTPEPVE